MYSLMMHNKLYLPLSESVLYKLFEDSSIKNDFYSTLPIPQIAALILLNQLPKKTQPIVLCDLEKKLAELIVIGNEFELDNTQKFSSEIKETLTEGDIKKGLDICEEERVYLLPDNILEQQKYLNDDNEWDYSFSDSIGVELNEKHYIVNDKVFPHIDLYDQQFRAYNSYKSELDEDIHIEGYAGSGKTYIINSIIETLLEKNIAPRSILLLTHSYLQSTALSIPRHITKMTFGWFAKSHLINTDLRNTINVDREKAFSDKEYAARFNIYGFGLHNNVEIARASYQTVKNYCQSTDEDINATHIPKWVNPVTNENKAVLVSHAEKLWQLITMQNTNKNYKLPMNDFHVIKLALLRRQEIKISWTYIIVDESHDLTPAVRELLSASKATIISLGDKFQKLNTSSSTEDTSRRIRRINQSIRVPFKLGGVVNGILDLHPLGRELDFMGNKDKRSELSFYTKSNVPASPTVIWVYDEWELFEWAARLASHGLEFKLFGNINALDDFVIGCINLYHSSTQAKVHALIEYKTWHGAQTANHKNRSFLAIEKMLERGYNLSNWKIARNCINDNASYAVGLFDNAKNHQFKSVMIARNIVDYIKQNEVGNRKMLYKVISRIYLGLTRSEREVIAPAGLQEVFEDWNINTAISGSTSIIFDLASKSQRRKN